MIITFIIIVNLHISTVNFIIITTKFAAIKIFIITVVTIITATITTDQCFIPATIYLDLANY